MNSLTKWPLIRVVVVNIKLDPNLDLGRNYMITLIQGVEIFPTMIKLMQIVIVSKTKKQTLIRFIHNYYCQKN